MGFLDWLTAAPSPESAAVRTPAPEPAEQEQSSLPASSQQRTQAFDPSDLAPLRASDLIFDPIFQRLGKWRDHQSHGRVTYDAMLQHPEVSAAFFTRLAFLKSNRPVFRPRAPDPTEKQQEIADFANFILSQLRWTKFIDGPIGQGFQYGFTLSEITTRVTRWRNKDVIALRELVQLPQATLDHGFIPREEFGELALDADPRYRCFSLDNRGRIIGIHQFAEDTTNRVSWEGPMMESILHFKVGGGDGNPYGRSVLNSAFYPWSELYATEQIEGVHRDTSLPFLFGTYKTTNNEGIARPAVHEGVKEALEKQGPSASQRFLMWADGDLKSVAPANADFTAAAELAKKRLTRQIWKSMLVPQGMVSETEESESDMRNLVAVYFKHLLKADLAEVGLALEDLVYRLIRNNYRALDSEDLPEVRWSVVTENELRVAQALMAQAIPYTDADKLGDLLHRVAPSIFEPDMIPAKHSDSVELKRPRRDSNDEPNSVTGTPPPKEPGEVKERDDGQTENPSQEVDNGA